MTDLIIGAWRSFAARSAVYTVLPDGCRDVVFRHRNGQRPEWFVSPLFDTATKVMSRDVTTMVGFRLKAGVRIDETQLSRALGDLPPDDARVVSAIEEASAGSARADDALDILALCPSDVATAARRLGVSTRTLQRHVLATTARSPSYWLRLSRARKCARLIDPRTPLSESADLCGYSDQSHMNREFRRWFGATPAEFLRDPALKSLIATSGYGDA